MKTLITLIMTIFSLSTFSAPLSGHVFGANMDSKEATVLAFYGKLFAKVKVTTDSKGNKISKLVGWGNVSAPTDDKFSTMDISITCKEKAIDVIDLQWRGEDFFSQEENLTFKNIDSQRGNYPTIDPEEFKRANQCVNDFAIKD